MSIDTLTRILRECFEDDSLVATADLDIRNLDLWDSFRHISMMVAVEETFGVVFTPSEVERIRSVADLTSALSHHGAHT